jgi:hypothetical protein
MPSSVYSSALGGSYFTFSSETDDLVRVGLNIIDR